MEEAFLDVGGVWISRPPLWSKWRESEPYKMAELTLELVSPRPSRLLMEKSDIKTVHSGKTGRVSVSFSSSSVVSLLGYWDFSLPKMCV